MRTIKFGDVLSSCVGMMGIDRHSHAFDDNLASHVASYVNNWIGIVWSFEWWPDLMRVEQRQYRDDWSDAKTYPKDEEVYYPNADKYYISLQSGNLDNQPDTATTFWDEVGSGFDRYVAYRQTGKTELGVVKRITKEHPRTAASLYSLGMLMSDLGVHVGSDAPTKVWVQFRIKTPVFTSVTYSDATPYVVDDVVYDSTTKECYEAILAGSGNAPSTSPTYWTKVDFPLIFLSFVQRAVYGDLVSTMYKDRTMAERIHNQAFDFLSRLSRDVIGRQGQRERVPAMSGR